MDVRYINPFLEALASVLANFGVNITNKGSIAKKDRMHIDKDVTSVIGLVGDIRGNVAYSLSQETAKTIVSKMMGGMPVDRLDEIARSAIGELANMITGTASTIISRTLGDKGANFESTPPSIIFGQDMYFIISSVQTIAVMMATEFGELEVNIGLEM